MLFTGSVGSPRPNSFHVPGMNCMTPWAPAGLVAVGADFSPAFLTASSTSGGMPCP